MIPPNGPYMHLGWTPDEHGEKRNKPCDKLTQAVAMLRATGIEIEDLVNDRLTDPRCRRQLAKLLTAIQCDWSAAAELRSRFAATDDPHGATETAAAAVARVLLGEPDPVIPPPPEEEREPA